MLIVLGTGVPGVLVIPTVVIVIVITFMRLGDYAARRQQ
jgi:hypothetical protein